MPLLKPLGYRGTVAEAIWVHEMKRRMWPRQWRVPNHTTVYIHLRYLRQIISALLTLKSHQQKFGCIMCFHKDAGANRSIHLALPLGRSFLDHRSWVLGFPGDLTAKVEGISLTVFFWSLIRKQEHKRPDFLCLLSLSLKDWIPTAYFLPTKIHKFLLRN